jgi:hypothetical protein
MITKPVINKHEIYMHVYNKLAKNAKILADITKLKQINISKFDMFY